MLFSSFDLRRRESSVAMLCRKPHRPKPSPTLASRATDSARAAVADRRGRATDLRARSLTSHDRARSHECPSSRAQRGAPSVGARDAGWGEGNFSSLQTIENKRNRIGIPPNSTPPGGCRSGGDGLAEPQGRRHARPRLRGLLCHIRPEIPGSARRPACARRPARAASVSVETDAPDSVR
jgi:hypothetical protein